jgi:hypothetical protein
MSCADLPVAKSTWRSISAPLRQQLFAFDGLESSNKAHYKLSVCQVKEAADDLCVHHI